MSMYSDFAEVYDDLMANVDYFQWAKFYRDILLNKNPNVKNITECACGTGLLTEHLSEYFIVHGIDSSEEMLQKAMQRARNKGIDASFSLQNMESFKLPSACDAVIATCDGVNYLLTEDSLKSFFISAYRALKDNGIIAFDFSSHYKLSNYLPSQVWADNSESLSYIWFNDFDDKTNILSLDFSAFKHIDKNNYIRIDEYQEQKARHIEEYTKLLKEVGFKDISIYGDMEKDYHDQSLRIHIVARR